MNKWVVLLVISAILFLASLGLLLSSSSGGDKSIGAYLAPVFWLAIFLWANQKRKEKPNTDK